MIDLFKLLLLLVAEVPSPDSPLSAPSPVAPLPPTDMVPGYEGAFLKMFLTLLALVIGLFFMIWMLRRLAQGRWGQGSNGRSIKIIDKRPLSPKTMLYIIEVGGRQTVIAESQLEVKPIATIDEITPKE